MVNTVTLVAWSVTLAWSVKNSHYGQSNTITVVSQKQSLWSVKTSHYGQTKTFTMVSQIQSLDSEMIEDRQIVV